MFFRLLKGYARFAIRIFCRAIVINDPSFLQIKGPVLFAANHPNSFLDGIILTTLYKGKLFTLARGDAFKGKYFRKILRSLRLLPVYRTSEGVENLSHNYTTFAACRDVFSRKDAVMIFSEGLSINEWHLRPLRKGTARIAISAWESGMDLTVIPVGFNYNTFRNFGKNVFLNFGRPISREVIERISTDGLRIAHFNQLLKSRLQELVFEIADQDAEKKRAMLTVHMPFWKILLLAPAAVPGFILHAPFYYPIKWVSSNFSDEDHFDGVMMGLCMLLYPLFLLTTFILMVVFGRYIYAIALSFALPVTAYAAIQLKPQV